ncbi:hypothetical protein V8C86DRAFT_931599 [Haematococcus lacustris]
MDPQLLSGSAPGASAAGKALGCRPLPRASGPGYGPSPLPDLDAFMQLAIHADQSHGLAASAPGCPPAPRERNVRSWSYTRDLPAAHSMLYNVQGSRWCGAVERQHRSNGVYYVADLKTGTWQQRCYDPLCRDYRSAAMPLPPPLWHHLLAHTNATDTNVADGGGIQEAVDSSAAADHVAAPLAPPDRRGPGPEDEDEAYQEACELALQQLENQCRG